MSDIGARCWDLREGILKYLDEKKTQQEQEQREHMKNLAARTNHILIQLYDKLHQKVYAGCGFVTVVRLFMRDVQYCTDETLKNVEALSGLRLKVDKLDANYVLVSLNGTRKRYLSNDDSLGERLLDFALLVDESNQRIELWWKMIDGLAERCIRKIIDCLKSRPNNFYGIPHEIIVLEKGQNAFADTFDFCGTKIKFADLQPWQVEQLQDAINERISHGIVSFRNADVLQHSLWCHIEKKPKRVVDNPLYDYAEFYQQYDFVTPELEKVFQEIADGLQAVPEEKQYEILEFQPKLTYVIQNDGDWTNMRIGFGSSYGIHRHNLFIALEKALPGIIIEGANFREETRRWASSRGCAHGVYHENQRIEFDCKVVAANCELAKRMLEVEQKILDLRTRQFGAIADSVTEKLLHAAELIVSSERDLNLALEVNSAAYFGDGWDLTALVEGHKIDPRKIEDEKLLLHLAEVVKRRTHGLIEVVDFRASLLHLNVSSCS